MDYFEEQRELVRNRTKKDGQVLAICWVCSTVQNPTIFWRNDNLDWGTADKLDDDRIAVISRCPACKEKHDNADIEIEKEASKLGTTIVTCWECGCKRLAIDCSPDYSGLPYCGC